MNLSEHDLCLYFVYFSDIDLGSIVYESYGTFTPKRSDMFKQWITFVYVLVIYHWVGRSSVFDYERVPSRNSRPHFKQMVSWPSSSHCCQVPGLLHHTESWRQRRSRNCEHLYYDERVCIFTCLDHRYMYPKNNSNVIGATFSWCASMRAC